MANKAKVAGAGNAVVSSAPTPGRGSEVIIHSIGDIRTMLDPLGASPTSGGDTKPSAPIN